MKFPMMMITKKTTNFNMNSQEQIEANKRQLRDLESLQNNCNHQWGTTKYSPEIQPFYEPGAMVAHGSDVWYETIKVDKSVPRWGRVCKNCGKEEFTYTEAVVEIRKEPKFS